MSVESQQRGIIVGVDGSDESQAAVAWAAREAALRGRPLTLVHVGLTLPAAGWIDVPVPEDYSTLREQHGHAVLAAAAAVVAGVLGPESTVPVDQRLVFDAAVPTLTDMSKDADLVVVGRRGFGAIGSVLLGSVSRGLLHHAHCPVAVIHGEASRSGPVVVGIDGSATSTAAIAIAFDEASRRGAGLVAVHAWLDDDAALGDLGWESLEAHGNEVLSERLAGWQERYPDVDVRRLVVRSSPARWIIEQSDAAQLVVVGSHGRGGFAGMLLGSVSNSIVQAARVPVIVARQS